ncbi:MAG: response regulator transcription factor [Chitinophagaceae bacterium]
MKTTVFIIEDSKEYQATLVSLITESANYQIGKVFSSAEEALPFINQLTGIIIVDIKLPGMNGANLVRHICESNKMVQCIICSMFDDDEFIFLALKNGALGYLLKDSSFEQILNALDELKKGGSPMSPYIARRVIASFQQPKEKKLNTILSDREQEVLEQLAHGLIYKEIGEKLFISHETVKQHIKHIYQKLHVQNKIEALNKMGKYQ